MSIPDVTSIICVKVVHKIYSENPFLIEDTIKQVKKYEPHYHYARTFTPVWIKFLEYRGIKEEEQIQGIHIPRDAVFERSLFIAVCLWLFSPSVYNKNADYNIENGVRHELKGLLLCNKEWISQQVKKVAFDYNKNYQEFKNLVDEVLIFIKSEVKEKEVIEEDIKEPLTMFE